MNLNKTVPKGVVLLTISFLFFIASVYLLVVGLSTTKADDGSGLGNFLGQATLMVAGITFLITVVTAFIGFSRYKNPSQL